MGLDAQTVEFRYAGTQGLAAIALVGLSPVSAVRWRRFEQESGSTGGGSTSWRHAVVIENYVEGATYG